MHHHLSAQTRSEHVMEEKASKQLLTTDNPIEKLRLMCLERGDGGILGIGRAFRRMDDNHSGVLNKEQFKKGIQHAKLYISDEDIEMLFKDFDKDESGLIKCEELIQAVRPKMSNSRLALVEKAFEKMDKTGEGKVNYEDLKRIYSVQQHPAYQNGECSETQLLNRFLKPFEENHILDGVTKDEFLDYYAGVSASIDEDGYFDLLMRQCWKL